MQRVFELFSEHSEMEQKPIIKIENIRISVYLRLSDYITPCTQDRIDGAVVLGNNGTLDGWFCYNVGWMGLECNNTSIYGIVSCSD